MSSIQKQNQSEARGVILGYTVLAEDTKTKETRSWNVTNTTFTNFTTQLCCHWVINISAFNSRGYSPPATIAILQEKGKLTNNTLYKLFILYSVSLHHVAVQWVWI